MWVVKTFISRVSRLNWQETGPAVVNEKLILQIFTHITKMMLERPETCKIYLIIECHRICKQWGTKKKKKRVLLVSQLAPKYPWRQRHSFGLTHTSFSLQVKLPSQRAAAKKERAELFNAPYTISHLTCCVVHRILGTCQAFTPRLPPSAAAHQSWWPGGI